MPPDPDPVDESFVCRRRPSVSSVELDGEAVLYDDETRTVHVLDRMATLLWQCVADPCTVGALIDDLADAYDADRDVVAEDVLGTVRGLARQGVLLAPGEEEQRRRTRRRADVRGGRRDRPVRYLDEPPSP